MTQILLKSDDKNATDMPSSLTMMLPRGMVAAQDTQTGLVLAGRVAQNRRDWDAARYIFTTLDQKFSGDSYSALRLMSLALGAGDAAEAMRQAKRIASDLDAKNAADDGKAGDHEAYDLAWLLLIAQSVKTGDEVAATMYVERLEDGAVAALMKPVLVDWISALTKDQGFSASDRTLSAMQTIYRAMAAEYAGNTDVAETLFSRIRGERVTPQTAEMMAAFYMRQDKTAKALDVLRRALVTSVGDDGLRATYAVLKDNPDAYEPPYFAAYHLKSPASGLALAFQDVSHMMLSERATDSALLFARIAAYLDPALPGIYVTIGDILSLQQQNEKALEAYRAVAVDDPDYIAAMLETADLLKSMKRAQDAIDLLQQLIAQKGDDSIADVYLTLGNVYKDAGEYKNAVAMYDLAETKGLAENDGKDPEWLWFLHYFRGVSFDLMGEHKAAEKDLLRALEARPDNAAILNYLGYSYADADRDLDKAHDMIARAVELSPEDAYILDSMGWVLYRMGRYDEAIAYLERAAQMRPYHAVLNDHLGDAYWQVGRRLEAHYMWQRAVDYTSRNTADDTDAGIQEQAEAAARAAEKLEHGLRPSDQILK